MLRAHRRRTLVLAVACMSVLVSACRGEPAIVTTPSPSPSPAPDAEITDANEAFRRTAAGLLEDAAQQAEVSVGTDALAAASGGGGTTLVVAAPIEEIEGLSTSDRSAGADLLLTFLPATLDPGLAPGPYVVRVQRGTRAGTWRALFVDLEGDTAGEVAASLEEHGASPSPAVSPGASPAAAAEECRVFLERSDRKVGAGVGCDGYTFSFSLGEDLAAEPEVSASDLAGRMASANDELRESIGSALCDEARTWDITGCPTAFVVGSRDDSLIVSSSLAPDEPVPGETRREGFDSMFNFMALPSAAGVPSGFGIVHIAQDGEGSWVSQLRSRDGRVIFEPIVTVEERPAPVAASPQPSPGDEERYVSYIDSSIVCTDHEYEEVDVGSGQSVTVVEIQCYSRIAAPTPTPEPAVRRTTRPTARPTPSPTPSPAPTPEETPEPTPSETPEETAPGAP